MRDAGRSPSTTLLSRAALALYPPSWRARYGDEVHALLDESGGGVRAAASVAWRAVPAWICPPAHLYDRPARMRASLSTGLEAWAMLTGLGLVFAQLTQFQGDTVPGHPIIGWSYAVFDAALFISVLAAGFGGLPLWLLMLRRARRERRLRDAGYLLLPLIAPAAYLIVLATALRLTSHPNGVSPGWFGVVILAGFAVAGAAAAGPGLAMRRLQPRTCRWPSITSATSPARSGLRRAASPSSTRTPSPTTSTNRSEWWARSSGGTSRS